MPSLLEDLKLFHQGEEVLRSESLKAIEANADLSRHVDVIGKAMDVLHLFSTNSNSIEDEDIRTVRLLGMRLFNDCATSFNLTASGYYQVAAMVMRDLLETSFLLSSFQHERARISEWRNADDRERKTKFSALNVRIRLDERDGFTEKRRAASYDMLCTLASHATYKGFDMLRPSGHGHHCGPFYDPTALKALIEELAKLAIQAGQAFSAFFQADSKEKLATKIWFIEATGEWVEKYFGAPSNKKQVQKLKEALASLDS